ncbi:MAG: ABC transporter ATP-binding protein [Actinomycetota bacterium]|nr:ABC transporter ATP-binding protein [Actinomycetota bacterium]
MPDDRTAIEARSLVKSFGDVRALDGFDINVKSGQVHGLVGPNGAGKTTLLRILFSLVSPDSGSITLLGRDWNAAGSIRMHGMGGFVEDPRFYPYLTARRNLEFLADLDGVDRRLVDEVLDLVRMTDRADRKVGGFSSGMRQRLGLAASLLRSPRLLLLDEPTVGLDPSGAREVLALVRVLSAEGTTILISSHNMTEVDGVCDSVTVMREGRSAWHGSMERLRSEAPAPAHRMWTSDDGRAKDVALVEPGVSVVPDPEGWLTVSADREPLDAYVIALGRLGVAVRRLEMPMTALESMFLALTGAEIDRFATRDQPDEIGVTR